MVSGGIRDALETRNGFWWNSGCVGDKQWCPLTK